MQVVVEFALQPRHETSLDLGIQLIKDFNYFKSKSRKRPRQLSFDSLVSLNSNDWEEYWETKVYQEMDLVPKEWNWNNVKTEITRLKGHCKMHSLYYCVFVFCILIVTHIKEENDLKYCRITLHWRLVAIRKRYLRFKRIKTLCIEKLFWTSASR